MSTTAARPDPNGCRLHRSLAVRPLITPDPPLPFRPQPLEEFAAAPLFAALDLIEHQAWPLARVLRELHETKGVFQRRTAPAHSALLHWTAEALERYLDARADEQEAARAEGLPATTPVRLEWIARTAKRPQRDQRGALQYEHTVWGRRYASADGRVRDLWIPSFGRAKADRSEAEKTAIAHVLAHGAPGPRPRWATAPPVTAAMADPVPERVRVFAFGCADGSVQTVLDWDAQEVPRRFAEHAAPAFHDAATGIERRPGADCVSCKVIGHCSDLRRTPSLWGGVPTTPTRRRRSLSVWDLRLHKDCPAQYHLTRRLRLASLQEEDRATLRGRAVDAWLNERHGACPRTSCRELPGPQDVENWSAGGFDLHGEQAREAAAMLGEHRSLCPLSGLAPQEEVLVQHQVTTYVPELDVVVIATPDLLHTRAGGWIWRETKTSSHHLWEREPLLLRYPQLALGVLMLNAGVLGADPGRSWVEFELLGDGHSVLERIDPSRPEVVDEAREVIAGMAQPLLDDTTYEPRPGRHCASCRARPWCTTGTSYVDERPSHG
ncbi:hypothetical protein AC230_03105 [Streptomyces caatingaensis]|uniref:PD-(D/E)XK endonuclease-like domain-containing protein n=1 Tax=Streptomyces caatingaensis TaxID=1678637 RepID=A0A0K9XM93_9ACTN|nr:hypothetical protein AC230_03105 [Streptomyces caatingaensis]